jgi:radical SAM protein with 4Fe4S-binding SPASM domain
MTSLKKKIFVKANKMFRRHQSLSEPLLKILPYHWKLPTTVMMEPTNICQLECPACPTPGMQRKKGYLTFQNFKKFVDMNPFVKRIIFNYAGETSLNQQMDKILKYAKEKNIYTITGTNCKIYNEGLLYSSEIWLALDGMSPESYMQYRGPHFEDVMKTIEKYVSEKKQQNLDTVLTIQNVVFSYNEHEIEKMKEFAKNMGLDKIIFKTACFGPTGIKDYLPKNPEYRRYDENNKLMEKPLLCDKIFVPFIMWDGRIALCCYVVESPIYVGNVFEKPIKELWGTKQFKDIRKKVVTEQLPICKTCDNTTINNTMWYNENN